MANLTVLTNQLKTIRKQIPFATAQALTTTARKNNLKAKVFVMNIAAEYLTPFEVGGVHKLNGAALLNPKNIKLNKYGNLPRNKLSSLKAKDNIFIGELKDVYGVFQRKKARKGRKSKKRLKRSPNGTRRDRQKQPAPKLLIRFGDALPVQPVLGYRNRAQRMAQVLLPQEINNKIKDVMRMINQ